MLKIKDNVDLKELKKYGFTEYLYTNGKYYHRDITVCKNRHLIFHNGGNMDRNDILYDLIKDGLVEKVNQ